MHESKPFSLRKRLASNNHAFRGLAIFIERTHNAWIHLFVTACGIYLGVTLRISNIEWMLLILAISIVFVAEIINTAIETHMNLTSPDTHPHARDTKDIAAAAVAVSVLMAGCVGLFIFLPKILVLF